MQERRSKEGRKSSFSWISLTMVLPLLITTIQTIMTLCEQQSPPPSGYQIENRVFCSLNGKDAVQEPSVFVLSLSLSLSLWVNCNTAHCCIQVFCVGRLLHWCNQDYCLPIVIFVPNILTCS